MTEVIESPSKSFSSNNGSVESLLKGTTASPSRFPLSPLHVNGRGSTTTTSSESPRSLGSPTGDLDEMGSSKHSEEALDATPKSNNLHPEADKFFHSTGRDRSRSHAITAAEAKAVGLVSLTDDAEEAALEQTWVSSNQPPPFEPQLDVSGTVSEEVEPEEMLPDVTLEIIERLARVEKHYDELVKRVAHMEDDMSETKGRATEFGQRMMKWKEEQEAINQQQQQVIATCIKQVVGLTGQLGGIAQPGFIDTISEQLAKGMTTEVFELRKELKNTQLLFEEFKFQTEQKEKKRQTEVQLQLDSFKDKLERKYPGKTLLDASLIPRLRTGKLPLSGKKISQSMSRIPRLRGPASPGGPSPPNSIPPSPSPKLPIPTQPRPTARPGARSPVRSTSHVTPTSEKTPVEQPRSNSRGRRNSLERGTGTPATSTPTPSYATPTSSSKRRNSLERTPSYSTPATEKRMSLSSKQPPPLGRSGSTLSSQTPARQTPTSVRPTAQTPRNRSSTITPQSAEPTRPRRVSLPSPAQNNSSKTTTPLAVAPGRVQAKPQHIVSPPN